MQTTQELTVFKFNEQVIRRVPDRDSKIFYCIADVCAALGIKKSWKVIARLTKGATKGGVLTSKGATSSSPLDTEEVPSRCIVPGGITWIETVTEGGVQKMAYTDEVGLYDIISKSRKPLAKLLYRRLIEAVPVMRQEKASIDVMPAQKLELASIKALAQSIVGLTDHVDLITKNITVLQDDVAQLKTGQEVKALLPPVPPLTRRNEIILFINKYMAKYTGQFNDFEDIWNYLYDAFRLRTRRDIKREARASRYMSVLAYVQSVGEIDRLWVVARDLFDK